MLRSHNAVCTGSTGVTLTVTHGLAQVPDMFWAVHRNGRGVGAGYFPAANVLTNTIDYINSLQSTVSVDIFCWFFDGRLY